MKIILASHYFHPHVGGIESVVESHAMRLAERGHEVTVISSNVGADSMHSQRDGYKIHRYKVWNPIEEFGVPYPLPDPHDAPQKIKKILADSEVDIVHVHGMNYLTTSAVLRYTPSKLPIVMHQHTPFVEYPFPFQLIEQINDYTISRWNLRQADLVFCVSSNIEQYVHELECSIDTELMTNGVDIEHFHPKLRKNKDIFNCESDTPVFFTLSRMSQKKGVDILLEAIRDLDRKDIDAHFAVAGDGPMRENIERISQVVGNMEVIGRTSDDELAEYYASADGFLFTSKSGEAFPTLTMIESYASGTPVIASELAENPVGVEDGVNSILIDPGNSTELTAAIIELATDKKRRSEMSIKARKSAEQHFSIESRIDRLESCYESISRSSNR